MVVMQTQIAPAQADPTAVMGRRIVAFLIDVAIGIAIAIVLFFAVAETATMASSEQASQLCEVFRDEESSGVCLNFGADVYTTTSSDSNLIVGVILAYGFFFQFLLPGVSGFSPGKGIMGLRVVKQADGQIAGIGANGVRWILWIVDGIPFMFPLVGLITGLTTKGHRRVGDMAASTLVVDKSQVGIRPVVPGLSAPIGTPEPWSAPPPTSPTADGGWASAPPLTPPTAEPAAPPPFPPPETPAEPPPFPPPETPTEPPTSGFPPPTTPPASEAPPTTPASDAPTTATPAIGADEPTTAMPTVGAEETPGPQEPATAEEAVPEAETETVPPAGIPRDAPLPDRPEESAAAQEPVTAAEPAAAAHPGVDAPYWDEARNTYIQWDPELGQWMEWSEAQGRWIPIST
jgi:uncharacterized RDD family membrane protein YckC